MSRGDRREAIMLDNKDRAELMGTLGQVWLADPHYCLMTNHFHLMVETTRPNLALGMKRLSGTCTRPFNRRRRHGGHLFDGRYKAQLIDERSGRYLSCACNLNPVRAGPLQRNKPLQA
jgi:hypothetical protein